MHYKSLLKIFIIIGFNPIILFKNIIGLPKYIKDYLLFKKQYKASKLKVKIVKFPILTDWALQSGTIKGHYFYQDFLIAKEIFNFKPIKHLDIGSRIDGFVAHVAVFREIEVLDIRPLKSNISNIKFTQLDLMCILPEIEEYYDSISSLHAIEHFGLGRYNDTVNILGHELAIENVYKLLTKAGRFYFSVPIGKAKICFNAHRIFDINYLLSVFDKKFKIIKFYYVDDTGEINLPECINQAVKEIIGKLEYGCGIFILEKI